MAIIYSYPINSNLLATDILVGTTTSIVNGKRKNQTKSFELGDLANFLAPIIAPLVDATRVPYIGATQSVNLGVYNITANSIIKVGGTNVQYLMADGSVSTGPNLTGYVPYTGATGAVNLGSYDLTVNGITAGRGGGSYYGNTVFGITAGGANTSGINNSFVGFNAGGSNTTGSYNTAFSGQALTLNLTGSYNTAIGTNCLYSNTLSYNTGVGFGTLSSSTTGQYNSAVGGSSGTALTTGISNSFLGYYSGGSLTTASYNTFIGNYNGFSTTTGSYNTAVGSNAFQFNISGTYNAVLGLSSNRSNTTGIGNATFGAYSAFSNTTGNYNTHIGYGAGYYATTGSNNVYLGLYAGRLINGGGNNIISSNSVFLGANTASLSDNQTNQIVIGDSAIGAGSNTVTIGNTSITTTRLRGVVQGGSFVKDSGTATQYLMADGSVTTNGTLYKATSTTYQTVSGSSVFYSTAISNIFADGDNLKIQTTTTTTTNSVGSIVTQYWINTTPSLTGATQIAQYSGNAGSIYYPMDRTYWVNGGNFYARNFTSSTSSSSNASGNILSSIAIPSTFYIIVQITTTGADLACLSSLQIIKS